MPSRMPVLFVGHGSPLNAIQDNPFTRALSDIGKQWPRPRAILCISAHWRTRGTYVTTSTKPQTIHDFSGFPKELFAIRYPAPGSPELADRVIKLVRVPTVKSDESWGFDHGSWAVLKFLYPKADVPVVQLSFDLREPGPHHCRIGEQLRPLRDEGVLILGSGNIVHNLGQIDWDSAAPAYPWALEFDTWVKQKLIGREDGALMTDYLSTEAGKLSVPSPDHYYPMLYVLGAAEKGEVLSFLYEGIQNASISMRAFAFETRNE